MDGTQLCQVQLCLLRVLTQPQTHTPSPLTSEMAFLMSGTLTGQWELKALLAHEAFRRGGSECPYRVSDLKSRGSESEDAHTTSAFIPLTKSHIKCGEDDNSAEPRGSGSVQPWAQLLGGPLPV